MKKQNKIYSISCGAFGYNDVIIEPEDSVIVWLDNHGFTHIYIIVLMTKIPNTLLISLKITLKILIALNILLLII